MKLSMIALGVRDPDASIPFYRDGLGWPIHSRHGDLVTFETGPTRLCLYPADALARASGASPGQPGASTLHSINVDSRTDVDRICTRSNEHGGSVRRAAAPLPWGGYGAFVADPDGHVWEIVHADRSGWSP